MTSVLRCHCPTSMSLSSSAPKTEKLMGWQLRLRRLTRQAVCVALKAGTATSSTRCPSSPAGQAGVKRERGRGRAAAVHHPPVSSLDWNLGALPQK